MAGRTSSLVNIFASFCLIHGKAGGQKLGSGLTWHDHPD
jgi:hypothetical protein